MTRHSHGGSYPSNWPEIANQVKAEASWRCIRCGQPHAPGFVLTVHHLDMNPANCAWWNLVALCQACHLHIQAKVVMDRPYFFEHSEWFRPYVAGYYAHLSGADESREYVMAHLDELLSFPFAGVEARG